MWDIIKDNKYSVGIVAAMLVLALGYSLYTFNSGDESSETADGEPLEEVRVGQEFFDLVEDLENIHFDTALLEEPAYRSLREFSYSPIPREEGRTNPFAGISADGTGLFRE